MCCLGGGGLEQWKLKDRWVCGVAAMTHTFQKILLSHTGRKSNGPCDVSPEKQLQVLRGEVRGKRDELPGRSHPTLDPAWHATEALLHTDPCLLLHTSVCKD